MTKLERADRATGPLVVGRRYLVPTVLATWRGVKRAWPVLGPEHDDADFLNFPIRHYHLDLRFLAARWLDTSWSGDDFIVASGMPLCATDREGTRRQDLPPPALRQRQCRSATINFGSLDTAYRPPKRIEAALGPLRAAYAGRQCAKGKLGSIPPAADGVITCPLHGLRIDAARGVVLSVGTDVRSGPLPHAGEREERRA